MQVFHDQTLSPSLRKVLKNWEQDNWGDHRCARRSPTPFSSSSLHTSSLLPCAMQGLLFTCYKFERLIELGPGPTPAGMATRPSRPSMRRPMTQSASPASFIATRRIRKKSISEPLEVSRHVWTSAFQRLPAYFDCRVATTS